MLKRWFSIFKSFFSKEKDRLWGAGAFLIPSLCLFFTFMLRGVLARGNASLFAFSFEESLVSRIIRAKEIIKGGGLLDFYGDSLSGDIFVFLVALLPTSISSAVVLSTMCTAAFTSLAFYLVMVGFGYKRNVAAIAGILYSLSSYSFMAFLFEGASTLLFILPLLLFALHKFLSGCVAFPFAIVLSLAFVSGARTGWIALLASVIWFFYERFGLTEKEDRPPMPHILIKGGLSVIAAIVIGLRPLVSAFKSLVLLPHITLDANFDILSFIAKLLPTAYDGIRVDSLPYISFGLLPVLVLPLYFSSPAFSKREKIASAILLGGVFLTMAAGVISFWFDLFGASALPVYAQTALFGFIALCLSVRTLSKDIRMSSHVLFSAYGFLVLLLVVIQNLSLKYKNAEGEVTQTYLSDIQGIWMIIFIATLLVFALYAFIQSQKRQRHTFVTIGLLLIVAFEAIYSPLRLLRATQNEYGYIYREDIKAYETIVQNAYKELPPDQSFYRFAWANAVFPGQEILSDKHTLSALSADDMWTNMLLSLGCFTDEGSAITGGVAALDSLLGVRFLAGYTPVIPEEDEAVDEDDNNEDTKKEGKLEQLKNALFKEDTFGHELTIAPPSLSSLYQNYLEKDGYTIYENPYALSLVMGAYRDLSALDFSLPTEETLFWSDDYESYMLPEGYDTSKLMFTPIERLNAIWSAILGKDVSLFTPLENAVNDSVEITRTGCQLSKDELGQNVYTSTNFSNPNSVKVRLSIFLTTSQQVLLTLPAYIGREAEVWVNGEYFATINKNNHADNSMLSLGKIDPGTLNVDIKFASDDQSTSQFYLMSDYEYLYVPSDTAFLEAIYSSRLSQFNVRKCTNKVVEGTLIPESGQTHVFTSLKYTSKTAVLVDGKKVEIHPLANGLLTFALPDDSQHDISIRYHSEALPALYTITSILGYAIILGGMGYETWCYIKKKKHQ